MKTQETLTIIAIVALGLCLLCGLAKMVVKNDKVKKGCDDACSLLVFVAVILVGISQLTNEGFNVSSKPETIETEIQAVDCDREGTPCSAINWSDVCEKVDYCKWTHPQDPIGGYCYCKNPTRVTMLPNYPLTGTETCDDNYTCCAENCCKENYEFCRASCNIWPGSWEPNCLGDCLKQRGLCSGACPGYLGQNIGCTS
jgi:hypothetical protein